MEFDGIDDRFDHLHELRSSHMDRYGVISECDALLRRVDDIDPATEDEILEWLDA